MLYLQEVNALMTGVTVVDLSKRKPATFPATATGDPAHHIISHNNKLNTLRTRIASLQVCFHSAISLLDYE